MEHELEDLPPELEELFDRARQEQPPPELLEQVCGGLDGQLATPLSPSSSPWALKLALTSLALGVIAASAVWLHGMGSTPTTPAVPPRLSAQRAAPDAPPPVAMAAAPAPAQAPVEPPVSPQTEPPPSRPRLRPSPLPSEAELLDRAQAASRHSPARALALTRRHARLYPHGVLAQEREALAIRALVQLRQVAAARRSFERFASQWPRSAHLHRLRQLVSEAPDVQR